MTSEAEEYSTEAQLRETFEEVGAVLEYSADAYLIGGGAMTLRETSGLMTDRLCGALVSRLRHAHIHNNSVCSIRYVDI
ncbi:MAG: hypothetical protein ABEI13_01425 [Candidatus Paceibacteria bacterium]